MGIPFKLSMIKAAIGDAATFWLLVCAFATLLTTYSVRRVYKTPPHGIPFLHEDGQAGITSFMPLACVIMVWPTICDSAEDSSDQNEGTHGCYALPSPSDSRSPLFVMLLTVIWLSSCFIYMSLKYYLWRKVAAWRGEKSPLDGPESGTYETVKAKGEKYASFIKVEINDRDERSSQEHATTYTLTQYHEKFLARLATFKNTDEKEKEGVSWMPPEDILDLLFFHGISKIMCHHRGQNCGDWAEVLCQQYSIGGIGSGPELTKEDMVEMAERELALPQMQYTVAPGAMPQGWRLACIILASIWSQVLFQGVCMQALMSYYWVY